MMVKKNPEPNQTCLHRHASEWRQEQGQPAVADQGGGGQAAILLLGDEMEEV